MMVHLRKPDVFEGKRLQTFHRRIRLQILVRPAALILAITMAVAIVTVHLQNGLFMENNGYEFGLALLAISVGLVFRGAGGLSADRWLQTRLAK